MQGILFRAALGTLFPFLMTTLGAAAGAALPRAGRAGHAPPLLGFAAGVMTAASVWSLLLPAMERASAMGLAPLLPSGAGLALGAVFLAALDAAALHLSAGRGLSDAARGNFLLLSAITLHNIPEGMAVGLAFALAGDGEGLAAAMALALGIGVQNLPEGAAVALPLRGAGSCRARAFLAGTLSGAVEPVFGVLAALAAARSAPAMPWLLSFAAGAMLYVVADELLPRAAGRSGTCGFLGGFWLMMALDVALG